MHRSLRLLAPALLLCSPALAQVDGLSYTFAPVGAYTRYDANAGLESHGLYGGRVGFGFGRFVELDAEYLRGMRTKTALGGLGGPGAAALGAFSGQDVEVQRAGVGLRVNVGATRLLPYVRGGAGVVQIDPVNVDATRSIYLNYGVGLTLSAAQRYTLALEASRDMYRYSPYATFGLGNTTPPRLADDFPIRTVHNLAFTGSLRLYLGGRTEGAESAVDVALREQFAGSGPRVFVEPSYGQVNFSPDLGPAFPKTQPFAGVSAGIDLGPFVGLRASYLRATNTDEALGGVPSAFRDMSLYGGELDLRFAGQMGRITPYLLLGGGYLNTGTGYAAPGGGAPPSDRYFAQAGAGLDLPLVSALRLKAAVRSLLMSDLDAASVATPSRVYSSLMVSAGLEFSLGGRPRSVATAVDRTVQSQVEAERARVEAEQQALQQLREAQHAAVQQRLRSEIDSLRLAVTAAPNDSVRAERLADLSLRQQALADTLAVGVAKAAPAAPAAALRPNVSGRTIEIPVPERGEIYIRYGDPAAAETQAAAPIVIGAEGVLGQTGGGLSAEQVAAIVRAELDRQRAGTLTRAEADRLVRDAVRNLEVSNSVLMARLAALEGQAATAPAATTVAPAKPAAPAETHGGLFWGRDLYSTMPFMGVRTGGVTQALVGIRGDFRLPSGSGMRFLPEVGIGVGDGVSIQAFANTGWGFADFGRFATYGGIGAGIKTDKGFTGTRLAINLFTGAEMPLGSGRGFAEFSTLDFFDVNRVLFGYRFVF